MVKVEYGSLTVGSTGNKIPVLSDSSLVVERVVLFIASSSTETSAGYYDGTPVTFTGGSAYGDENSTNTITHYRNISGTKTKVFEGTVTNLDTGEFTVNVTTCTQSTSLKFVVFGS